MEEALKKPRRIFTPRQKYEMLKEIERRPTLKEGLAQYDHESCKTSSSGLTGGSDSRFRGNDIPFLHESCC